MQASCGQETNVEWSNQTGEITIHSSRSEWGGHRTGRESSGEYRSNDARLKEILAGDSEQAYYG